MASNNPQFCILRIWTPSFATVEKSLQPPPHKSELESVPTIKLKFLLFREMCVECFSSFVVALTRNGAHTSSPWWALLVGGSHGTRPSQALSLVFHVESSSLLSYGCPSTKLAISYQHWHPCGRQNYMDREYMYGLYPRQTFFQPKKPHSAT
jgi:hypothetical protein